MEVERVANLKTKGSFSKLYTWLPIILLFVSVLNEFDFNYLKLEYFSFNFPFILIFFFTLKDFNPNEDEIMAVEHKRKPIFGIQYHPESFATEGGKKIILNFLKLT